ncbi:MAG: hypothetical protein ACHQ49_17470 [Elusimicrobiota bacterium]
MERIATEDILMKVVAVVIVVSIFGACGTIFLYDHYKLVPVENEVQRRFQPAIDALGRYNQAKGRYPDKLDSLLPGLLTEIPACPELPSPAADRSVIYDVGADGKSFNLGCRIGGLVHQQETRYGSTMMMWERM